MSLKHGQSEKKEHSEGFEMWLWRRLRKGKIDEVLRKIKEET